MIWVDKIETHTDDDDDGDDNDDIYIMVKCVCLSVCHEKVNILKGFCFLSVSRHFPYSRNFVLFPVSTHFWKILEGKNVDDADDDGDG